jgi:predicted GIY-YIG superfamily endonuclease
MTWTVYAIAPEGDEDHPFYIGITIDPAQRAQSHNHRDSAAYDKSQALEVLGKHCVLYPLAHYATEIEARAYETAMIALHDGLMNRTIAACTRAMAQHYDLAPPSESNNMSGEFLAETVGADG